MDGMAIHIMNTGRFNLFGKSERTSLSGDVLSVSCKMEGSCFFGFNRELKNLRAEGCGSLGCLKHASRHWREVQL